MRFVWLHELFHALNGHTGLLASRHPGAVLNEMPDENARVDSLRHLMEYDADRSASGRCCACSGSTTSRSPLAAWPRPLRLKLAIFAAATMTVLFDQAARRPATTAGHHPVSRGP